MGTCGSGPGQRDQRSADCYAQLRSPCWHRLPWQHVGAASVQACFTKYRHPHKPQEKGSVIAMPGQMWKAPCHRKGRNISRPDFLHTHHPANLLEPTSQCHESLLPSSFPRMSLRVAEQAGYFRHMLDRILPCIAVPQSIIWALLIPHNHWTIVIMIYWLGLIVCDIPIIVSRTVEYKWGDGPLQNVWTLRPHCARPTDTSSWTNHLQASEIA